MFAQRGAFTGSPVTKFAQRSPYYSVFAKKSPSTPQTADFGPFFVHWANFFAHSPTTRPSRENFVPHAGPVPVQNSPGVSSSAAHPVQNSPGTLAWRAQPVQNSPSTPETALFDQFYPSRENFVPHAGPMPVQNSPSSQPSGRHRYKTLPAPPKWPISARFTPAGRTLYRSHHQQVEQGEKSPAPTPHLTHQRAPPTISHAILLHEFSTKPRNVAIPTT